MHLQILFPDVSLHSGDVWWAKKSLSLIETQCESAIVRQVEHYWTSAIREGVLPEAPKEILQVQHY
jgi:hypothetical protein